MVDEKSADVRLMQNHQDPNSSEDEAGMGECWRKSVLLFCEKFKGDSVIVQPTFDLTGPYKAATDLGDKIEIMRVISILDVCS